MVIANPKIEQKPGGRNINNVFVPDPSRNADPITPDALKSTTTPFKVPVAPTPTADAALQGAVDSNTDAFTANLDAQAKASADKKASSLKDLVANKLGTAGEQQQTATAYAQKGGVDDTQVQLNDINQRILAEKTALDRTVERLQTKGGGLASGADAEIANAQRDSYRKQADLSLIQLGIQRKYDSAKAIADRAVAVQLEKDKITHDTLQTIYDDNKDQYTKDEQKQFETAQADRNRALDDKKTDLDRKYALVLDAQKNGAPEAIIQSMLDSKTSNDALTQGTDYIGKLDRQLKQSELYTNKLQQDKLLQEINPDNNGDSQAIVSYAQQYQDTGKLPSPAELKQSGLTISQVTEYAKQAPKANGALVSTNTGVKSSNLSTQEEAGIQALSEIVNQTLPALQDRFSKLHAGIGGKVGSFVFTSQDRQDYRTFRADFLSKLLVARSGTAVSDPEYKRISDLVPTELANWGISGITGNNPGGKTLESLSKSMKETLDSTLKTKQQSIYGYSKVQVPNLGEHTVGEVLDVGGTKVRVLPDGTLTDII